MTAAAFLRCVALALALAVLRVYLAERRHS